MKRRELIKSAGLAVMAGAISKPLLSQEVSEHRKPVLTIAHITDVHIPENNPEVKERIRKCFREIKRTHRVDFILNGGDSIMDASYDNVSREKMLAQWSAWDEVVAELNGSEIFSCIGNHDSWWAAPGKDDKMYGKDYVISRLRIPARYYSFDRSGWHFIILDGNNEKVSLDEVQFEWLKNDLSSLKENTPVLLMSHFPVFGATPVLVGGNHSDNNKLKSLFYQHRDKVRGMLSGHNHLVDQTVYNNVQYCCNGALSGFWWGDGDQDSAGKGYYFETPPGFAILRLYADGKLENEYIPHNF
ncbi:MAG: metallophosphoesterase [Chitinophagaceae bacterium]